ncbi:hypothetical protein CyaNS01_00544 [Cyanobium sp. NS01]|nr:hypothetical protein CyaNS01_00544 [Cyanobium sp. NS01]
MILSQQLFDDCTSSLQGQASWPSRQWRPDPRESSRSSC